MPNKPKTVTHSEVIVIGAGAAGLLCAIECSEKGVPVTLLEKNPKPGMKILISGGGRCNFTHLEANHQNYISGNPHFCKSALAQSGPDDFLERLKRRNIEWVEKKKSQLFSANGAKTILQALLNDLKDQETSCITQAEVEEVSHDGTTFQLKTPQQVWTCDHLVVASGGLSWPKLGVSDVGYRIAEQFGHKLTKRKPGLVPLLWDKQMKQKYTNLSGLSTQAKIAHNGIEFEDGILFTHHGLSGPVILQISSYWNYGEKITIEWCPIKQVEEFLLSKSQTTLQQFLSDYHPKRWAQALIPSDLLQKKSSQLTLAQNQQIKELLCNWVFTPHDQAGYGKAEVTLGGIDTKEVSSKTMESKLRPQLYFIGEVLDVTGQLGGFNFQWAWSSGTAAAKQIAGY